MTEADAMRLRLSDRVQIEERLGTVALVRRNGIGIDFDDGEYRFLRRFDFADLSLVD